MRHKGAFLRWISYGVDPVTKSRAHADFFFMRNVAYRKEGTQFRVYYTMRTRPTSYGVDEIAKMSIV